MSTTKASADAPPAKIHNAHPQLDLSKPTRVEVWIPADKVHLFDRAVAASLITTSPTDDLQTLHKDGQHNRRVLGPVITSIAHKLTVMMFGSTEHVRPGLGEQMAWDGSGKFSGIGFTLCYKVDRRGMDPEHIRLDPVVEVREEGGGGGGELAFQHRVSTGEWRAECNARLDDTYFPVPDLRRGWIYKAPA